MTMAALEEMTKIFQDEDVDTEIILCYDYIR